MIKTLLALALAVAMVGCGGPATGIVKTPPQKEYTSSVYEVGVVSGVVFDNVIDYAGNHIDVTVVNFRDPVDNPVETYITFCGDVRGNFQIGVDVYAEALLGITCSKLTIVRNR